MSQEQHTDSTPDENPPKRRKISADEVLVEAARNGDTTAVRARLEKISPDTASKTVSFDAVHEACRGNHDECLALLLSYVETAQRDFGMLLSECIHADHTACTEVLLQHWKSVCSNVAFVPHGQEDEEGRPCPAMWADPAVCQVLIDAGADIETKDDMGRSPLHWSCRSGALAVVKFLVEAGAGVCAMCNFGNTCPIFAAYHGHTETVRYLVGLKDVDVNHKATDQWSALFCAVRRNHPDVVKVLIDAGADIETRDEDSLTPLVYAGEKGNLLMVKMLLEAGADVRAADKDGCTCLLDAAIFGHTETVRYLVGLKEVDLDHKCDFGWTALFWAVHENHPDVVEVLIDAGADVEVRDKSALTPLVFASEKGKLPMVKMLVEAGASVCARDHMGRTCFWMAAAFGHTETARYLVRLKGVDVDAEADDGLTAVLAAAQENHPDVMKVLIDAGADIEARDNSDGRTPLHVVSQRGHIRAVEVLIRAGAGVCYTNDGNTCLVLAAGNGHTETVRTLLYTPEMDVNQSNTLGFTPLHLAVLKKHSNVVQVLINAGADIEAKGFDGSSPLHCVCEVGELEIAKMLVEAGADVCVVDDSSETSLIRSARDGYTEIVRYLASFREVDVNHRNLSGHTALYIARQKQHAGVVQILLEHGAEE